MMNLACPIPFTETDRILLGHGSGGRLTHQLIDSIFYPHLKNELLEQNHDGCVFPVNAGRMAISTDSFVVNPVFFPGGNIGDLAVNGTVNDLACCGAKPLYLTAGFIIEEGLLISDLEKIVSSMKHAANACGIQIIAGDTKVVEHGKCDKIFINTSGIGIVPDGINISPKQVNVGDVVICSGPIGVHGITILSAREGISFGTKLISDTAGLNHMIGNLIEEVDEIHVLRDPTRGGVSGTLNEIAQSSGYAIELEEELLPIPKEVQAASDMLGLDPLYIANEGLVLVILPEKQAEKALSVMQNHPEGKHATIIGRVTSEGNVSVRMKTLYGSHRIVSLLNGNQLPRIC